jgi:Ca2+-dependent lipid-binding protein
VAYVPSPRELNPPSLTDMGSLQVEVIDAESLLGSDRSGKSDVRLAFFDASLPRAGSDRSCSSYHQPFVVFHLNGEKVFKSQVKKKTRSPVWDERFEVLVASRWGSKLTFEVFDWNQVSFDQRFMVILHR